MGDPHGPNRLYNYLELTHKFVQQWVDQGFVHSDTLVCQPVEGGDFVVAGYLGCQGRIILSVEKLLEVRRPGGDALVQTLDYSYNVSIQGRGNVFRYDNSHGPNMEQDDPIRQRDEWHHKHTFPLPPGARGKVRVEWGVPWPHLDQVISEAHAWYLENRITYDLGAEFPDPARFEWGHFAYATDPGRR